MDEPLQMVSNSNDYRALWLTLLKLMLHTATVNDFIIFAKMNNIYQLVHLGFLLENFIETYLSLRSCNEDYLL